MGIRHQARALVNRIRCTLRRHRYAPAYETRTLTDRSGRYVRKEFQFECRCCGQKTKWLRWSRLAAFIQQHQPRWGQA